MWVCVATFLMGIVASLCKRPGTTVLYFIIAFYVGLYCHQVSEKAKISMVDIEENHHRICQLTTKGAELEK